MEERKEKRLIENFLAHHAPLGDYEGIIRLVLDNYRRYCYEEGFETISYLTDHDDYVEQTRKHFPGEYTQEVPQGIQGGANSRPRKGKKVSTKVLKSKQRSS